MTLPHHSVAIPPDDVETRAFITPRLGERFWARVARRGPDECWPWTGPCGSFGYGLINSGRIGRRRKTFVAHRLAYELSVGPIPKGMCICHRCDNPPCVNPAHLFLGTQGDNMADKDAKGRGNRGERNGIAKLTAADVVRIRELLAIGWEQQFIAPGFGVTPAVISKIARRQLWAHVQ